MTYLHDSTNNFARRLRELQAKHYGPDRLEAACARAGSVDARSYRHVDSILKHGLDRLARLAVPLSLLLPTHEHLRGPEYYQDAAAPTAPGLALRHPANTGPSRALVEKFVQDLATIMVETELLTEDQVTEIRRVEAEERPRIILTRG